jgi:hypothetical protein
MSGTEPGGVQDPPLHVEPEGVKPELRRVGHRWVDLTIALTAILLSLVSLAVAIGNARTQEKMVAAATWPLLQFDSTNVGPNGERKLELKVTNTGVGPALLKDVRVSYRDRPVKGWPFLLMECCGWNREVNATVQREPIGSVISNGLSGSIIRPGEELTFIEMVRTPVNAEVWDRLDQAVWELKFDACYCSVFDECWRSDLDSLEARRVKRCEVDKSAHYR